MKKEEQKIKIEKAMGRLELLREKAPPGQQSEISLALKFMRRAVEEIEIHYDSRGVLNTIMRTPSNNEECEEIKSGLVPQIIGRLIS